MKKQNNQKIKPVVCDCGTKHKVMGIVALVGLFACGLFLGLGVRNDVSSAQEHFLSKEQCDKIETQIVEIVNSESEADLQKLDGLRKSYSAGCPGRLLVIEKQTVVQDDTKTCTKIENLLSTRLLPDDSISSWDHFYNADTYGTMAEFGCPENVEMFKQKAVAELEIASALIEEWGTQQAEIVIDTYKKLDMQNEAKEFLNKLEKLTDPAIDFILKMEKVINEEF